MTAVTRAGADPSTGVLATLEALCAQFCAPSFSLSVSHRPSRSSTAAKSCAPRSPPLACLRNFVLRVTMPAVQKALYSRFAEIGRVVLISYGPEVRRPPRPRATTLALRAPRAWPSARCGSAAVAPCARVHMRRSGLRLRPPPCVVVADARAGERAAGAAAAAAPPPPPAPRRALRRAPLQTGKLATIVDIVDHNLALIDGPETITGVKRQVRPPPRACAAPARARARGRRRRLALRVVLLSAPRSTLPARR